MQCHNCRSQVPEGIAFCQQCGMPLSPPPPSSLAPTVAASQPPYANPSPYTDYNPSSMPPTVAAPQPPYANPSPGANFINPSSMPPTVAAPQPPYANPSPGANFINPSPMPPTVAAPQPPYASPDSGANYNAPTVAAPQPSYANPSPYTDYNPSSIPSDGPGYGGAQNPYANVPPYDPYGQPQPSNMPLYAPPPPNNVPPPYSSPPPQGNLASYGAEAPAFAGPMPVKRKRRVGLIVLIIIIILAIVTIGSAALASKSSPTIAKKTPSGTALDATASSIVTNIQMASAVDTNTLKPTKLTTSFKEGTDIYATFQFGFSTTDVNQQNPGYVTAKFYKQGTRVFTADPLKVDDEIAPTGHGYGYFTVQYPYTTTDGSVELYWCRQSTCSDAKLAQTTTFTVY